MGEVGAGRDNEQLPGQVTLSLVSNFSIPIFLTILSQLPTNLGRKPMRRAIASAEVMDGGSGGGQRQRTASEVSHVLSTLFIYLSNCFVPISLQFR